MGLQDCHLHSPDEVEFCVALLRFFLWPQLCLSLATVRMVPLPGRPQGSFMWVEIRGRARFVGEASDLFWVVSEFLSSGGLKPPLFPTVEELHKIRCIK